MDVVVYDEEDRRYVPLVGVLVLALVVAALTAGVSLLLLRDSGEAGAATPPPAAVSRPQPGSVDPTLGTGDSGACQEAVQRADVVVRRSERIADALASHTRVMDDLLAGRTTAQQALDRDLPALTEGATDRERLAEERAAYQRSRDACVG